MTCSLPLPTKALMPAQGAPWMVSRCSFGNLILGCFSPRSKPWHSICGGLVLFAYLTKNKWWMTKLTT